MCIDVFYLKVKYDDIFSYLIKPVIPRVIQELVNNVDKIEFTDLFAVIGENGAQKTKRTVVRNLLTMLKVNNKSNTDYLTLYFNYLTYIYNHTPSPNTWPLDELMFVHKTVKSIPTISGILNSNNKSKVIIACGFNAYYIQTYNFSHNCIIQLASQYNFLESTSNKYSEVYNYLSDLTQGPIGSATAMNSLFQKDAHFKPVKGKENIYKNDAMLEIINNFKQHYLEISTRRNDNEKQFINDVLTNIYIGGYLNMLIICDKSMENIKIHLLSELYLFLKTHINKINIMPQWVISEYSKLEHIQIFSASPSYQYIDDTSYVFSENEISICTILAAAQMRSVAYVAVLRRILSKNLVNVHLTLIGQGSFKNPKICIQEAIKEYYNIIKYIDGINTYIHCYGPSDLEKLDPSAEIYSNELVFPSDIKDQSRQNFVISAEKYFGKNVQLQTMEK